ncbi:UV DNA damage repair endonuclease UvsE [Brassicibacter mesophilus]|uniref:UV DNA damage repair endonuclease UvsE n=1 Tax=Brassicibacter mesophilus TaxID=745119 RepID=UPI003D1C9442
MIVRLGYVAMAVDLKDCSPSKTITYSQYSKMLDDEVKLYKLKKLAKENLINTKRILLYNAAHDIKVYRITSKLIPLINHPNVSYWNYIDELSEVFDQIKAIINKNNFRISAHPDHFTLLSSPRQDVISSSINDLVYHNNIMKAFGLDHQNGKLVIHVGGKYNSKKQAINRFKTNFSKLPEEIRNRIILENDDKIYDLIDVLEVCEELKIPMVLDIHHQWCNNRKEKIEYYLERVFNTWNDRILIPKIHVSSPKSELEFRAHANNINPDFFFNFIYKAKTLNKDFDVMIEAKNKNLALINLMNHIRRQPDFKIIDASSFEV